ncbi:MAG: AAA family ATPase, partial [Lentisphaerota bacterium]
MKKFNVTGSCNPQKHYMVDISGKFNQVMNLIEQGEYFAINRPRQYGKTTMLNMLSKSLWNNPDKYVMIRLSFEGLGDDVFNSEIVFVPELLDLISSKTRDMYPDLSVYAKDACHQIKSFKELSAFVNSFVQKAGRDVIMFIDEVDKSSNNQLFLNFLGMLRDKYIDRDAGAGATFLSVVLAGIHDVKSLKLKIRKDDETKINSPWNIAADFNVDMSFNPAEIKTMLISYAEDTGANMDFNAVAKRIHYYTGGYPFLVSKICKNIAEEEAGQNPGYNPKHWTLADIDWSFQWLTRPMYTTTNFDDMIKNLENNKDLFALTRAVSVEGSEVGAAADNPVVNLGVTYGILSASEGRIVISNRVYEQRIATYMQSKKETAELGEASVFHEYGYLKDGRLVLKFILEKFQIFMKEHYSAKDSTFLEREGRLVFMSFLKPLINGKGFMWKEPVTGNERRMDIVITYGAKQKDVVELKIWRGEEYHQEGLHQLSEYLDFQNLKHGYLLIFDFNKNKQYKSES